MGNTIRATGLSSGMDTQSIVEAMLSSYQAKIDKQKANQTKAEWKQEIYTDLNSKLKTFKSSLTSLKQASNLCTSKTSLSQTGVVTVQSATYNGQSENHSILVEKVASKANVHTAVMGTYTNAASEVRNVSAASSLDEVFSGDSDARNATIKIGNATVNLSECTHIQDIVNSVKEQDSNVQIAFNESISAFTISSAQTGDTTLSLAASTDDAARAFKKLGIGDFSDTASTESYHGEKAKIKYNDSLEVTSDSNYFEINGLCFTAQSESATPVTVSVSQDTEQTYEKIKKVIESYNAILSEVTTKYYADSASKYDVLTDDEKDAMSDSEVATWNDKIKGSLLRRDSNLKSIYDSLRSAMTTDYSKTENGGLDEHYGLLSQIGISSSSWTDQGKLTIDEDKLKTALSTNGEKVADLISTMATNLEKKLGDLSSKRSDYQSYGSFFNDKLVAQQIIDYNDAAEKAQDKYDTMETFYYNKFTAMEKAYQKMNSQSSLFSNL